MSREINWDSFAVIVADFLGVESESLRKETNIYNDLGLDSLGVFSLGMTLLKEFKINVPLSVVSTINTVGDMYEAMKNNQYSDPEDKNA